MAKKTREMTAEYYARYHATPEAKKERAMRNAARRDYEKKGLVHKGDGKDIDHIHPLSRGGTNAPGNLRVTSTKFNRGYPRDSKMRPLPRGR